MGRIGVAVASIVVLGAASLTAANAGAPVPSTAGPSAAVPGVGSAVLAVDLDHRSLVVARVGQRIRTVASGFTDPVAVVTDRRTAAYVLDAGARTLLRVGVATGDKTTLRSAVAVGASMAVDDAGNLYLLDGTTVLEFVAGSDRPKVLGPTTPDGRLTVDGRGAVSVASPRVTVPAGVRIKTFPAGGGAPRYRNITVPGQTDSGAPGQQDSFGYLTNSVESRDGTVILELVAVGGSGAHFFVRVPAGSSAGTYLAAPNAEYAYSFDRNNNFYLAYNRFWCTAVARHFGCVDDYGVDDIDRFAPAATAPTAVRPVNGLSLPVGGIAVDDTGRLFGAVLVSRTATAANGDAQPALVTVATAGGRRTVLASGHFSSPVVFDTGCAAAA